SSRFAGPKRTSASCSRNLRRRRICFATFHAPPSASRSAMNEQPRWLHVFNDLSTSSFVDILRRDHPHLLVEARIRPEDVATVPHGTTVLSVSYRDGVIMAGDRQATAGYQVASRRIEK